jgi:rhodanese-related sulfurtransferase
VLDLGDQRIEVLHTPGHTEDSISLRVGSNLLTGDFLFLAQDGAGRLDFEGSDPGAHWDSLQKLASFGDEHRVLPGHDYNELTDSTLGVERKRNPRFQQITREEYVAWQRAVAMPTPDWMLAVIAANLGKKSAHEAHHAATLAGLQQCAAGEEGGAVGACIASPSGRVPLVGPREAARRMGKPASERPFLLDVREGWEYRAPRGRHAPGAQLIPLGQLGMRLAELPKDPDAEVMVICETGGRSARAAEFLISRGRRRVFNVAGGTSRWEGEGLPVER